MKIDTLKDLEKVLKLCRKEGVESIRIDGIEFHLGQLPLKQTKESKSSSPVFAPGGITDDTQILNQELTPEQLLFYSAQDHLQNEKQ